MIEVLQSVLVPAFLANLLDDLGVLGGGCGFGHHLLQGGI